MPKIEIVRVKRLDPAAAKPRFQLRDGSVDLMKAFSLGGFQRIGQVAILRRLIRLTFSLSQLILTFMPVGVLTGHCASRDETAWRLRRSGDQLSIENDHDGAIMCTSARCFCIELLVHATWACLTCNWLRTDSETSHYVLPLGTGR